MFDISLVLLLRNLGLKPTAIATPPPNSEFWGVLSTTKSPSRFIKSQPNAKPATVNKKRLQY